MRSESHEAPPFLQVKCPPTFNAAPSETSEASLARRPPFLQINLRVIPCFATAPFGFTLGKSKDKTINKEFLQKKNWGLRLGIILKNFFLQNVLKNVPVFMSSSKEVLYGAVESGVNPPEEQRDDECGTDEGIEDTFGLSLRGSGTPCPPNSLFIGKK